MDAVRRGASPESTTALLLLLPTVSVAPERLHHGVELALLLYHGEVHDSSASSEADCGFGRLAERRKDSLRAGVSCAASILLIVLSHHTNRPGLVALARRYKSLTSKKKTHH